MDIEALLLASNKEAADELEDAYEDVFEEEDTGGDTEPNKSSEVDKAAVLMAAAQTVAKEEKRYADKVLFETADQINESYKSADQILEDASKEVNKFYNDKADEKEAEKFTAQPELEPEPAEEKKEEESDGKSSSDDDDDDGEEDEDGDADDEERMRLDQSLLFACFNEKLDGTRTALKKGANYFTRDRHGWTALMWVASKAPTTSWRF